MKFNFTMEDKKKMDEQPNFKQHIKQFGTTTSIKGISKIIKSECLVLKVIWFVAVITGATIAIYFLSTLIVNYFSYALYTKMSICNDCHAPFPDITVCNLNPLALTARAGNEILQFDQYLKNVEKIFNTVSI